MGPSQSGELHSRSSTVMRNGSVPAEVERAFHKWPVSSLSQLEANSEYSGCNLVSIPYQRGMRKEYLKARLETVIGFGAFQDPPMPACICRVNEFPTLAGSEFWRWLKSGFWGVHLFLV